MLRFIFRVLLTAFAFKFIFTIFPGIEFTGSFGNAIVYGLLFSVVGFVVGIALFALTAALGVATAGVGAVIIGFVYILGFWLLPALQLELLAHWFPQHLSVNGFGWAILAGLILMVINAITAGPKKSS